MLGYNILGIFVRMKNLESGPFFLSEDVVLHMSFQQTPSLLRHSLSEPRVIDGTSFVVELFLRHR